MVVTQGKDHLLGIEQTKPAAKNQILLSVSPFHLCRQQLSPPSPTPPGFTQSRVCFKALSLSSHMDLEMGNSW